MKNCTALWREAHVEVKSLKNCQLQTTFGNCDVEKVRAVVVRSTFRSQQWQSTPFSDHFSKLRCRKIARGCGAKHISKSKVLKTEGGSEFKGTNIASLPMLTQGSMGTKSGTAIAAESCGNGSGKS